MWLFCFSQHHLLRTTVLSPTEGFWHRVENHVTIYARVHFWSLSSIPQFTYLPVCQCQTILMTLAQLCVFWNYVESCLYSWGSCWVGFFYCGGFLGFLGLALRDAFLLLHIAQFVHFHWSMAFSCPKCICSIADGYLILSQNLWYFLEIDCCYPVSSVDKVWILFHSSPSIFYSFFWPRSSLWFHFLSF